MHDLTPKLRDNPKNAHESDDDKNDGVDDCF
nr:MAG TPA: hypothetical protein [Caudoviricetes sp.]